MPCLGVVCNRKRKEWGTRSSAKFEDWLIIVGVKSSALPGGEGWIFGPESESPICTNRGYQAGMNGR
jgi:hypothetical protein